MLRAAPLLHHAPFLRVAIIRSQGACEITIADGGSVTASNASDHAIIVAFIAAEIGMHIAITIAVLQNGVRAGTDDGCAMRFIGCRVNGCIAMITALHDRTILQHRNHAAHTTGPIVWIIRNAHISMVAAVADIAIHVGAGSNATGTGLAAGAAGSNVTVVHGVLQNTIGIVVTHHAAGIGMGRSAVCLNETLIPTIANRGKITAANAACQGIERVILVVIGCVGIDGAHILAGGHIVRILTADSSGKTAPGIGRSDFACVVTIAHRAAGIAQDTRSIAIAGGCRRCGNPAIVTAIRSAHAITHNATGIGIAIQEGYLCVYRTVKSTIT